MISSKKMIVFTLTPEEYTLLKEFVRTIDIELDAQITFREFEQSVSDKGKQIKVECWIN